MVVDSGAWCYGKIGKTGKATGKRKGREKGVDRKERGAAVTGVELGGRM
jgi:hypothetical protein